MIAIGQDPPAAARDTIDRARQTRADRHHAASERVAIARLHDQMGVIALQRVLHQPESGTDAAARERALDPADDPSLAERRQPRTHAEGDVRRHDATKRRA